MALPKFNPDFALGIYVGKGYGEMSVVTLSRFCEGSRGVNARKILPFLFGSER